MYEFELWYRGETRIGDISRLASGRAWSKVLNGIDTVSFTVDAVRFGEWLNARGYQMGELLAGSNLDVKVKRRGEYVLGAYIRDLPLPTYSPDNQTITLNFDGYAAILDGFYIEAGRTVSNVAANTHYRAFITEAQGRAATAGWDWGLGLGADVTMPDISPFYGSDKKISEIVSDAHDNINGSGSFDFDFTYDRKFNLYQPKGQLRDFTAYYPTRVSGGVVTNLQYEPTASLASVVKAVGNGDNESAIRSTQSNTDSISELGYVEMLYNPADIKTQSTLDRKASLELSRYDNPGYLPKITLLGAQLDLTQLDTGDMFIFVNDRDYITNTSGVYRILQMDGTIPDDAGAQSDLITLTVEPV
ncbi:MAG: hypothetical protein ACK5LJ_18090 [Paracoccus sp. (in: a-proteobacteria)]